jgi:hypothetical protein
MTEAQVSLLEGGAQPPQAAPRPARRKATWADVLRASVA